MYLVNGCLTYKLRYFVNNSLNKGTHDWGSVEQWVNYSYWGKIDTVIDTCLSQCTQNCSFDDKSESLGIFNVKLFALYLDDDQRDKKKEDRA